MQIFSANQTHATHLRPSGVSQRESWGTTPSWEADLACRWVLESSINKLLVSSGDGTDPVSASFVPYRKPPGPFS